MSKLAKLVRKPKTTGGNNVISEAKRKFDYEAFVMIINILEAVPKVKQDTANFVQQAYRDHLKEKAHGADALQECTVLDQYSEDWKACYLSKKLRIPTEHLGKAKVKAATIIHALMRFLLNATGALSVPDECSNSLVMEVACDRRIGETGGRVKLLLSGDEKVVGTDGEVNYNMGVYGDVQFKEGVAISVVHRPTQDIAEIDPDARITKVWRIRNPWDDHGAQFFKSKTVYRKIADFFEAGKGPHKIPTLRGASGPWKRHVQEAYETVARVKKTLVSEEDKAAFTTPIKAAKSAGSKRAREALMQRKSETDKRRRASLEG